jgi:hypothetical protein
MANGGDVTAARRSIVETFVAAEKASGAWDLTDDYWALWAENAPQALTSLKQRRLATATAAPTFTIDRGYVFNGTTQFINTGFIATSHAVAMAVNSNRIAYYERADLLANNYACGASAASNAAMTLRPRATSTIAVAQVATSAANFTIAATSLGYLAASRSGATAADCLAYKNGAVLVRAVDPSAFGVALPNVRFYIGGYNSGDTLTTPRATSAGFMAVGAALSAAQELAQYNAVQAWATSVGANV